MNEADFREELDSIARDLLLEFDPVDRKWGIYQKASYIITTVPTQPYLLFKIEDEDGNPRLPDRRDLGRSLRSVTAGRVMQKIGSSAYVDEIERKEQAKKDVVKAKQDERISWAAKQIIAAERSTQHSMRVN
jgi:hypothetical protein